MVDFFVVIGFKMVDEFVVFFCFCKKKVFNFILGINNEFCDVSYVIFDREKFCILILGGDDFENFD